MPSNTLEFKELKLRNFLSFGPKETSIPLDGDHITVILGENRDTGGEDSRNGAGKAQPLNSKILTPYGWSTMCDMKVGSSIISGSGKVALVTGVYPKGTKEVYDVTFSDGRIVRCCADHLWKVWKRDGAGWKWCTVSLSEIITHRDRFPSHSGRVYVPLFPGETDRPDRVVPLDPYLLGLLIGDGNLTRGVRFTTADECIAESISHLIPRETKIQKLSEMEYRITTGTKGKINPVSSHLRSLGLWGKRSWEKNIPDAYMSMSILQTEHLLQGLLDTDGTVDHRHGSISFTTTSAILARQVQELVWKIGGIAKITEHTKTYTNHGETKTGRLAYRVGIRHPHRGKLFRLKRKLDKIPANYQYSESLRLEITDINMTSIEEVQCITVSDPNHLYVTDGYVVTHNSALLDALCYCLFGKVIRGISNQKLINKMSSKGSMVVSVRFTKGEHDYLIERTERPSKLFLLRKPLDSPADFRAKEGRKFKYDISRGKNETTDQIIGILGFDITLFEYLVVNSSESIEFLRLPEEKRRGVIEHLFGFTIMTEKAKLLKEERKEKNKELLSAESAAEATKQANARIEAQIKDLETKSKEWNNRNTETTNQLKETISSLETVDTESEIEILRAVDDLESSLKDTQTKIRELESEQRQKQQDKKRLERELEKTIKIVNTSQESLKSLDSSECPTCHQHWEPNPEYREELQIELDTSTKTIEELEATIITLNNEIDSMQPVIDAEHENKTTTKEEIDEISAVELTYSTIEEAASAGATLKSLKEQLQKTTKDENPYIDSIQKLRQEAIQKVDDSKIKELRSIIEHYTFLIDLLTKKDSFLRQQIIDRWLPILNRRITYWLDVLELPHTVTFQPDLTVDIVDYHESFDFGNLSKGERNRIRIALNLAFQDVFEYMNYRINLLAIDELIDSGICPRGAENTVTALKETCNQKHKRAFLITHRDDISARVDDIMTIVKENRISRIEYGIKK